jgi:hypothetical protein
VSTTLGSETYEERCAVLLVAIRSAQKRLAAEAQNKTVAGAVVGQIADALKDVLDEQTAAFLAVEALKLVSEADAVSHEAKEGK